MSIAQSTRRFPAPSLLALSATLVCSSAAYAANMLGGAYEPFNYPADSTGELVVGNNLAGGAGWNATGDSTLPNNASSRWADASALPAAGGSGPAKKTLYPTLSYTSIGYPIATGGKAAIDASLANATNN